MGFHNSMALFNPLFVVGYYISEHKYVSDESLEETTIYMNKSVGDIAKTSFIYYMGSQLAGSLLAWLFNLFVQIAKKRHEQVCVTNLDVCASGIINPPNLTMEKIPVTETPG